MPSIIIFAFFSLFALVALSSKTQPSYQVQLLNLTVSKKVFLQQVRCQGFRVPANYRKLKLTIQSENIEHLLITSRQINSCQEQQFSQCDQKSNLCIESHISAKTEFSIGKCMDHFYLYAYIDNFVGGSISVKVSETSGCDNILQDEFTSCASIPLNQCGVKNNHKCNDKCVRIDCTYTNNINKNLTSLSTCVPTNSSPSTWYSRCNEQNNFFRSMNKKVILNQCNKQPSSDIYSREGGSKVWKIIEWIFILLLLLLIVSVIYYRYKMKNTGRAPFSVPNWAPSFLYPRPNSPTDYLENYRQI